MLEKFEDDYMDEDVEEILVIKANKPATSVKHIEKIREFVKLSKKSKDQFSDFVKKD